MKNVFPLGVKSGCLSYINSNCGGGVVCGSAAGKGVVQWVQVGT